ncbi:CAP domain-containing protein [Paludisphaera mucosa]|uniref:CAP domain-containing protein n=1 Tax=Paludisphaera mucosa TaxID=3030827 RepID=A0ABT6F8H2_9BACT|nr:CAP domain-containing protein [Paludisphaera mucosa]MDG3003893.1 CAP domain-containing protein [Paludisphaera mucosa]
MTFVTTRSTRRIVAALAALAVALAPGCVSISIWPKPLAGPDEARPWPKPDAPGELDLDAVRESLLKLHNEARAEKKRGRLAISRVLQEAAQAHAEEMAERRKMTHTGADGSSVAERIRDRGYDYRRCGENIAYGHYSPELVVRGWLTSPPHRKNILGGFTQIGLGYATDKNGTPYWCVTFGLPLSR